MEDPGIFQMIYEVFTVRMRTALCNLLGCECIAVFAFWPRTLREMAMKNREVGRIRIVVLMGLRTDWGDFSEKARKRLGCGPINVLEKLQKSREIINFTAFYGGLEGIRTLDLCDANAALSQLSYEPVFVNFSYFDI